MSRILMNHNPTTGVSTYYRSGEDGQFYTEKVFDVEPLLDATAQDRADTAGQRFGDVRRVARIPGAIAGQLMRDGRLFDQAYMRKWLRENSKFLSFEKTW